MGGRGGAGPASNQGPPAGTGPIAPAGPPLPKRPTNTIDFLNQATTRAESRQMLSAKTIGQLRRVAEDLGMKGFRSMDKETLRESIVEQTVGNRINSQAIRAL